jgi:hypothetical protein
MAKAHDGKNKPKARAQGARKAKCYGKKPLFFPPLRFISRGRALRGGRPARINCRESSFSLTGGPHHDRGGHATANKPSSRRRIARTVTAVTSACPRRPLRARAVATPKKARPRRKITATTA